MSRQPLVSITVPCHNAAPSLAWALASVMAQTYDRWECIVVDDGSEDKPADVVDVFSDSRFRLIRLDKNMGRAKARQAALDAATGDYLAKLDADDWLYPEKLERQVEVMEREANIALVSTGIAIEDEQQRLVGVRARGPSRECIAQAPLTSLVSPPVAHAASMIRMPVAKQHKYNPYLLRSEDADYLLKVLLENRYAVLNDVLYSYLEYRSATRAEVLDAYRYRMHMFWAFRGRFPVAATRRTAETALKWVAYRAAFAAGRAGGLVARRSDAPTTDDMRLFAEARRQVADMFSEYFEGGRMKGAASLGIER